MAKHQGLFAAAAGPAWEGEKQFAGAVGGGVEPAPPSPLQGLKMSGTQKGPGGGSASTPKYTPQNHPHDTLLILRYVSWGKFFS